MEEVPAHWLRFALAFAGALIAGYAARRGRFCTLGAIEDATYGADWARLRAWALATALALAATQTMAFAGLIDLKQSVYVATPYTVVAYVVGGLAFGFGMALVGTCGFGTLLRIGGGDLRALVTFGVIAVSAFAALRGLASEARIVIASELPVPKLPALAPWSGRMVDQIGAGVILAALLGFGLSRRMRPRLAMAGAAVGITSAYGWWVTGVAGHDPMAINRLESYSYVAPLGQLLVYVMTSSIATIDFAHGAVLGVVTGAFLAARHERQFRWEAYDDAREMRRHLVGGAMMGLGGVTALGCTIGQGVTGISTLSLGSLVATAAILTGARLGLYWLIERKLPPLRSRGG